MDLQTALEAFRDLEHYTRVEKTEDGEDWEVPVFSVRLDAGVDRDEDRTIRIRVSPGVSWAFDGREDWGSLLDLAKQYKLDVEVQNNALELS